MSRAAAQRLGWTFTHVAETGSTNTDLADAARRGDVAPAVRTTDHQTAGRGRLDRTWQDDGQGQLMVSIRLPATAVDAFWISAAVAVAARRTVAALGLEPAVKWPNDLLLGEAKLAGVLAEYVVGTPDVVVVGMGLNVGSSGVPDGASLAGAGVTEGRDVVLAGVLAELPGLVADPAAAQADVLAHSATVGRIVRVEQSAGVLVGRAATIDDEGRLVVETDQGRTAVAVGDVVHLRSVGD